MPTYLIVEAVEVRDAEKYREYIRLVPETIAKFGGRYLARGGKTRVLDGDWKPERLIIVEFESMERCREWFRSPDYKAVAPLREAGARVNAVLIEGYER